MWMTHWMAWTRVKINYSFIFILIIDFSQKVKFGCCHDIQTRKELQEFAFLFVVVYPFKITLFPCVLYYHGNHYLDGVCLHTEHIFQWHTDHMHIFKFDLNCKYIPGKITDIVHQGLELNGPSHLTGSLHYMYTYSKLLNGVDQGSTS